LSGPIAAVDLQQIFPTILLRRRLETVKPLNGRLRGIVLEREKQQKDNLGASNVGGWHSPSDLMDWDFPEIRILTRALLETGAELTRALTPPRYDGEARVSFYGGCWANVLRNGGDNRIHNHPGAVWSGCYYVSCGAPVAEPPFNGWIEFQDPRPGNLHGGKERVEPEEGLLLIFPSWLNHFVNPFMGSGERISIAFNLDAEIVPREVAPSYARSCSSAA